VTHTPKWIRRSECFFRPSGSSTWLRNTEHTREHVKRVGWRGSIVRSLTVVVGSCVCAKHTHKQSDDCVDGRCAARAWVRRTHRPRVYCFPYRQSTRITAVSRGVGIVKIWGLRPHLMPANRTRESRCQWTLRNVGCACGDVFGC